MRNRIELVVVALRAGDGQAEEAARGGIHAIVLHLGTQRVEAEARPVLAAGRSAVSAVAGDLRFDEQVVRHVVVEAPDHPVAIAEGSSGTARPAWS